MDFDVKSIGLAAKDIILGVGTAAAGASGGPAAAEGVGKAGGGLDRILSMAGVTDSRADKFDRADFAARPQAQKGDRPVPPPNTAPTAPGPPAKATADPAAIDKTRSDGAYTGDTQIAAEHLGGLGWTRQKIQLILNGPEHTSLAAVLGSDGNGVRPRESTGTQLPQQAGMRLPTIQGRAVASVEGQVVPTVRGQRQKDPGATGT